MSYLQEIHFSASNKIEFRINIISHSNSKFSAESTVFDPAINPMLSSYHPLGVQFSTAKEAFQEIANYIDRFVKIRKESILKIDNPCNAPFINKADQQAIINGTSFKATVLVNGQ